MCTLPHWCSGSDPGIDMRSDQTNQLELNNIFLSCRHKFADIDFLRGKMSIIGGGCRPGYFLYLIFWHIKMLHKSWKHIVRGRYSLELNILAWPDPLFLFSILFFRETSFTKPESIYSDKQHLLLHFRPFAVVTPLNLFIAMNGEYSL